jgi:F-type H+-transporting ATPase subunit delta
MRGASADSLARVQEQFEDTLASTGGDAVTTGRDLFAISTLLDRQPRLLRLLTDTGRDPGSRAEVVERVLRGKADERAVDATAGLARGRFSDPWDFSDAVETLGLAAVFAEARRRGTAETIGSELHAVTRALEGEPETAQALDALRSDPARRADVLERVLAGKVDELTVLIARQMVERRPGERAVRRIEEASEAAAAAAHRVAAVVTSATPLTRAQQDRLAGILANLYEGPVQLHLDLDPTLVGGLRVEVGDDIIDASVVTRLADARRRMTQ